MAAMPSQYLCIAPDLRGYGDTKDLPIDATRGVRDLSDDLSAVMEVLGISSAHLAGWSAGAGVIMQFALDYPAQVDSLCLIAPVSPFGFGGTCDVHGTPTNPDFAGSGGGIVNPDAVDQLHLKNTGLHPQTTPRQVLRNYFVNAQAPLEREDILVNAMLQQKLGEHRYPGDYLESPYPPHVAPGKWGPMNALSPKYFNTSNIVDLANKPPILWVHGDEDCVINDRSLFDLATATQEQALVDSDQAKPDSIRPQPMVGQMKEILRRYALNNGQYEEMIMENVGHSPFMEAHDDFLKGLTDFLSRV